MSLETTLAQLVAIDSTSSRSNGAIVEFALARAVAAGMRARVTSYRDERGTEKFQMLAFAPGETDEVELALVGHTDTVKKPRNPFIFRLFSPTATLTKNLFRPSFTQRSHKLFA